MLRSQEDEKAQEVQVRETGDRGVERNLGEQRPQSQVRTWKEETTLDFPEFKCQG